jgi:hypothetical protein
MDDDHSETVPRTGSYGRCARDNLQEKGGAQVLGVLEHEIRETSGDEQAMACLYSERKLQADGWSLLIKN